MWDRRHPGARRRGAAHRGCAEAAGISRLQFRRHRHARARAPDASAAPAASWSTWRRGWPSAPLSGNAGIGHTRWATHGAPTEANAHPQATDRVAVVHNGIIENFQALRRRDRRRRAHACQRHRHGSGGASHHHGARSRPEAGGGGGRHAEAAGRRLCARGAVRRRGGSPGRGAARQPARHRARQGRDVPRLRRHRAGALHRFHHLSGRRRLGRRDAPLRARYSTTRARWWSARSFTRSPPASPSTRATTGTSCRRRSTSSRR